MLLQLNAKAAQQFKVFDVRFNEKCRNAVVTSVDSCSDVLNGHFSNGQ